MGSAALTRLESLLDARKLAGTLTGRWLDPGRGVVSTGLSGLDGAIDGGWPRGELSDLSGARSTGRTTVAVATMAAATAREEAVALVDTLDRFDPASAAAAGVHLDRLLWVRGPSASVELGRAALVEQALHRAVSAFDLLLRAGGFSVVFLDLVDVPARVLQTLPFATWMRLAHVNEHRHTAAVLLGDAPIGRSARGASVRLRATATWQGTSAQTRRFTGLGIDVDTPHGKRRSSNVACRSDTASFRDRRAKDDV